MKPLGSWKSTGVVPGRTVRMPFGRFGRLSVRRKTLLVAMIAAVSALLPTVLAAGLQQWLTMRTYQRNKIETIATLMAPATSALVAGDDARSCQILLDALVDEPTITRVALYGRDGAQLALYERNDVRAGIAQQSHTDPERLTVPSTRTAHRPLYFQGEQIGTLDIQSDAAMPGFAFLQGAVVMLGAMILALLIAFRIASKLQHAVSKPIAELAITAAIVTASRNYSLRATRYGDDEIGLLADGFNEMLSQVELSESQLIARTHDLEEAKQEAMDANDAKSELLANMSHELRTPMHAISSFARFGVRKAHSADRDRLLHYFNRVQDSSDHMVLLLNDLLDLAKLQAQHMEFTFSEQSLSSLLSRAKEEVDTLLFERSLTITVDETPMRRFAMDPGRILQMLRNLLNNAIKFSPENGTIAIVLSEVDSHARLVMSDEGVGVPADQLETIFQKFVQSSLTKTGAGGTGLGLAICREIATAHEGRIWAENNETCGSSFIVELPMRSCDDPIADAAAIERPTLRVSTSPTA